jgi:hypothetical protein
MYLSAERLALANQAVKETFEQCSIVWQAIPHWNTGDPGQIRVADGKYNPPGFLDLLAQEKEFKVTLAEANAPTPNLLLTQVMAATKDLAKKVDDDVLKKLFTEAAPTTITETPVTAGDLQDALIEARVQVEDGGYRAPSCLVTNTAGLKELSQLVEGVSVLQQLLSAANINALHRSQSLDDSGDSKTRLILIGRRRRIPQGAATEASPGEEPVDLAVSLLPSLEVDGETDGGKIGLSARIRYATRITDATGLVAVEH